MTRNLHSLTFAEKFFKRKAVLAILAVILVIKVIKIKLFWLLPLLVKLDQKFVKQLSEILSPSGRCWNCQETCSEVPALLVPCIGARKQLSAESCHKISHLDPFQIFKLCGYYHANHHKTNYHHHKHNINHLHTVN